MAILIALLHFGIAAVPPHEKAWLDCLLCAVGGYWVAIAIEGKSR